MDNRPLPLIRAWLPRVPLIGTTVLRNTLGFSAHSHHWDLWTELTVAVLRSFINTKEPSSVCRLQAYSIQDKGIWGRIWVSKETLPRPPEDDVRDRLIEAIEGLKRPDALGGGGGGSMDVPELSSVQAEWNGYREAATPESPRLSISESEQYLEMMKEVKVCGAPGRQSFLGSLW